jgi:hypothetical protein
MCEFKNFSVIFLKLMLSTLTEGQEKKAKWRVDAKCEREMMEDVDVHTVAGAGGYGVGGFDGGAMRPEGRYGVFAD